MKGDFSRLTFDPKKHYRGVRMQQGRVQLDADWNEQIDILNHTLETQLQDLLGPSGAAQASAGFKISVSKDPEEAKQRDSGSQDTENEQSLILKPKSKPALKLHISSGRYYVDGMLCENEQNVEFTAQPVYPQATIPAELKEHAVVYLDTWQRHITAFEDATLREVALGGIDTTTRMQNAWRVNILPVASDDALAHTTKVTYEDITALPEWQQLLHKRRHKGTLSAKRIPHSAVLDNRLYRVEIHNAQDKEATFKWSRENGAVVFDIEHIKSIGNADDKGVSQLVVVLGELGRDMTRLQLGDWVEIAHDATLLGSPALPLYRVVSIPDITSREVTLSGPDSEYLKSLEKQKPSHLLLCRWDHDEATPGAPGTLDVKDGAWLDLERGLQVSFTGGNYEVGDYWLIPSRTVLDGIDWPVDENGKPLAQAPHGSGHHYCPLALLHLHESKWSVAKDLRQLFAPLPVVSAVAEKPPVIEKDTVEIVFQENPGDLFEQCTSKDKLAPGDLVSLVPRTSMQITKANRDNARLVFGVVSGETEVDGEKHFRVTVYGRARCKVIERIEAGDLLTVSEVAGCATRTGPAHRLFSPGTILGKALDSYEPRENEDNRDSTADTEDNDTSGVIDIMVTLH